MANYRTERTWPELRLLGRHVFRVDCIRRNTNFGAYCSDGQQQDEGGCIHQGAVMSFLLGGFGQNRKPPVSAGEYRLPDVDWV
jgi:hypothetical protein